MVTHRKLMGIAALHPSYWLGRRSRSVARFKDDEDARWLRFVRPETGQRRITPVRKIYNLAAPTFLLWRFGGFEDVKTTTIEKERMVSIYAIQFFERRMIFREHFGLKLAQGLFELCRIQLHGLSYLQLFGLRPEWGCLVAAAPDLLTPRHQMLIRGCRCTEHSPNMLRPEPWRR